MRHLLTVMAAFVVACGSTAPPPQSSEDERPKLSAEDFAPRPRLLRAEVTTEVDPSRYRALAPPTSVFRTDLDQLFLVGKLKDVPTDATIEVKWFLDAVSAPVLESTMAADVADFIATFAGVDGDFDPGAYTVRIYVDGKEVGAVPFRIDRFETDSGLRASKITFSKKLNGKLKAKRAKKQFQTGTDKVWVSFDIAGTEPGRHLAVRWFRGDELFHESHVDIGRDKRYAAHVFAPEGLPSGDYTVELESGDMVLAQSSFMVGNASKGPLIEEIALGTKVRDRTNMPEERLSIFERDTGAIHCGLRFLDLPPETTLEIRWTRVVSDRKDDGQLLYINRSVLPAGGSGTMGAAWQPEATLLPGHYKAVVVANDEVLAEQDFEVQ